MSKILVIEDNYEIRENLAEFLQLSGHETVAANCGVLGIQIAKEFEPDLIICDILMPGMDGYTVFRTLSGSQQGSIPFIFSTSMSEKSDIAEAMSLGAYDFIVKPYELDDLLIKIENCLNSLQRRQQSIY